MYTRPELIKRFSLFLFLALLWLLACGIFEIGVERTAQPDQVHPTPPLMTTAPEQKADVVPTTSATQAIAQTTPTPPTAWENLPPGLVYKTDTGLWLVKADEQPIQIHTNPQALLSPDGTRLLNDDPLQQTTWLLDLTEGTISSLIHRLDRVECCFQWWPARPEVILFNSTPTDFERGPGLMGYLSVINLDELDGLDRLDGPGYRILDTEHDTGPGQFALSPDGQTIAYGGGSAAWLYHWETGPALFEPATYGLTGSKGIHMGSPAWSPDGKQLAWVINGGLAAGGGFRMGIGVFDLERETAFVLHLYEPVGRGNWPAAPLWSPDGTWLAFTAGSQNFDQAGLWVIRADGQQEEEYYLGWGGNPVWSPDGNWLAFQSAASDGPPVYQLAEAGTWNLRPLSVPYDRYGMLVDWIKP